MDPLYAPSCRGEDTIGDVMTDDLAMMSATELVGHYRRKTLSPVEVTEAALERIDRCNGALNAMCHLDPDTTRAAAKESEARWQAGRPMGLVDGGADDDQGRAADQGMADAAGLSDGIGGRSLG